MQNNDKETTPANPDRAEIMRWLKRGEIQALAKKFKISSSMAYKVVNGKVRHFEFLQACYEKAIERKQTQRALSEKLRA